MFIRDRDWTAPGGTEQEHAQLAEAFSRGFTTAYLEGKRIGDGQVRPHLYAGTHLSSADELPEAFGHDRLIGVDLSLIHI